MAKNITILEQSAKALYSALSREDAASYSFSSVIADMTGYDAYQELFDQKSEQLETTLKNLSEESEIQKTKELIGIVNECQDLSEEDFLSQRLDIAQKIAPYMPEEIAELGGDIFSQTRPAPISAQVIVGSAERANIPESRDTNAVQQELMQLGRAIQEEAGGHPEIEDAVRELIGGGASTSMNGEEAEALISKAQQANQNLEELISEGPFAYPDALLEGKQNNQRTRIEVIRKLQARLLKMINILKKYIKNLTSTPKSPGVK